MMETDSTGRFSLVAGRLRDCVNRVSMLLEQDRIRDIDEIWEAYCDVEEGIALSNFAIGAFDRLGKMRKLSVSLKDDPKRMQENELRKKFSFVIENIRASLEKFSRAQGEDGAEMALRAREVLKKML